MIRNLMLIDDDEDDRGFFLEVVKDLYPEMNCIIAENGKDALDKLSKESAKPELIFLDLNMPLMNGRQFLREIKQREGFNGIPVVILSTSSDEKTKAETSQLGATDFITKPDKFSVWQSTLKNVFNNFTE